MTQEPDRLARCPHSPNCVCSEYEDGPHFIEPIVFSGAADVAWNRLVDIVKSQPRTRIEQQSNCYLQATARTAFLRFVDVVEFRLDVDASRIHVRSKSKLGEWDLGVNRRRIEHIRERWQRPSS